MSTRTSCVFEHIPGCVRVPCCVTWQVMLLAQRLLHKFQPRWVRSILTLSPIRGGLAFLETDEDGRIRFGIEVAGMKFSDPIREFPSKLLITQITLVKP